MLGTLGCFLQRSAGFPSFKRSLAPSAMPGWGVREMHETQPSCMKVAVSDEDIMSTADGGCRHGASKEYRSPPARGEKPPRSCQPKHCMRLEIISNLHGCSSVIIPCRALPSSVFFLPATLGTPPPPSSPSLRKAIQAESWVLNPSVGTHFSL